MNKAALKIETLQQRLLWLSFANLLVVALLGVLLRAFPFLQSFPLSYKNLLHGHSHFAFGGWVLPVLLSLVMRFFPLLTAAVAYRHWRNITLMVLLSAYGMLIAFPLQGYKAVSIGFSTLSLAATVYLAVRVWKAAPGLPQSVSLRFLRWGLFYGVLSALGPLATGPLVVLGHSGSALYFDVIYFFLHFQYNGLFTFVVLALLYRAMEKKGGGQNGGLFFRLFNWACLPTYALSVLWHQPPLFFYGLGGAAAVLQLVAVLWLLKDVRQSGLARWASLLQLSLAAFVLKNLLQVASAFPVVAQLAAAHRNFVIAYLHLVLLGFVTLAVFALALQRNHHRWGAGLFLFSFFTTETLLVLQAAGEVFAFRLPFYPALLLGCSLAFPVGILPLLGRMWRRHRHTAQRRLPKQLPSFVGER